MMNKGFRFMGHPTQQLGIIYYNLEVANEYFAHRVDAVFRAMGIPANNRFHVRELRGSGINISAFADLAVYDIKQLRASGHQVDIIVIDPIYKLYTGDDNSNSDAQAYLDYIMKETGVSIIS